jgi:hypothetical protein
MTSQILALTLLLLSNLINMSISLFVWHPSLTFLNSACTSFTPNQVYPFVHVYHRAISLRFCKRLPFAIVEHVYRWFWASTLHGVGPLSSHVIMISLVPSCIYHVRLYKRMSYSITPRIDSAWKFLPWWVMSSSTLQFEKVLFDFEHLNELMDQEDVSNGAQHKESREAQSKSTRCYVTHARKEKLHGKPWSFLLQRSEYPPFSTVNASSLVSCAPSFVNLRIRFLLRGEGCNTPYYGCPNYSH